MRITNQPTKIWRFMSLVTQEKRSKDVKSTALAQRTLTEGLFYVRALAGFHFGSYRQIGTNQIEDQSDLQTQTQFHNIWKKTPSLLRSASVAPHGFRASVFPG